MTYLVLLSRKIIRRLDRARHARIQIRPPAILGIQNRKAVSRSELEAEVDLAVFARLGGFGLAADFGGEFAVEV